MKIRFKNIDLLSISWLAVGIVIFLLGWCRWYYAVPLTLLVVYVVMRFYAQGSNEAIVVSKGKLIVAVLVIALMMVWCGIGGYVVQPNDHFGRNAIFTDTWRYSWPVYDVGENHYQCYYLAFWMLPALVGKLFNSLDVGFFAQLVWISIGFTLLWLQICRYMCKARISYLFFFYLFCGLKLFECIFYLPLFGEGGFLHDTVNILATNGSPQVFHAGPMVQLLYDPFNQTIPLFLGMMLMINNTRSSILPFVYSLLLLYAPFPFAGLAPLVLYWWVKNIAANKKNVAIYIFSIENITALLLIVIVALYLLSNINGSHKGLRPIDNLKADIYGFLVYVAFEFVIYMAIGYKVCTDKPLLWIAFGCTCVFGWFQIGLHNDFCFRSNMPLIFILCLLVIKRYYAAFTGKTVKVLIIACYTIGGLPAQIHPCLRLLSTYFVVTGQPQAKLNDYQHFIDVRNMYIMQQTELRNDDLKSTFHCGSWGWMCDSFKGRADSFFFRYIAKKHS